MKYIKCKVWCFNEEQENLTGKKADKWLDYLFKVDAVDSFKRTDDPDEFCGENATVLQFHSGAIAIVDIKYNEMMEKLMSDPSKELE